MLRVVRANHLNFTDYLGAASLFFHGAWVIPGTMEAANSLPIDCSAMIPNTISAPDGGIFSLNGGKAHFFFAKTFSRCDI